MNNLLESFRFYRNFFLGFIGFLLQKYVFNFVTVFNQYPTNIFLFKLQYTEYESLMQLLPFAYDCIH